MSDGVVNKITGELLEDGADVARYLGVLREERSAINTEIAATEDWLIEQASARGERKLHFPSVGTVQIEPQVEKVYDVLALVAALKEAGMPAERIDELVKEKVEKRVDGRVANAIARANPTYGCLLDQHRGTVEKRTRVSLQLADDVKAQIHAEVHE
jgi:hypothetical protein